MKRPGSKERLKKRLEFRDKLKLMRKLGFKNKLN
jgi:hypothetical protein